MGLRHADSITGYREALEGDLYATRPTDLIVLKFGQVDCDFVYYLKLADKPGLDFEAFAADSVSKYFSFIDDALASLPVTRENLCIMTPFATCVPDATCATRSARYHSWMPPSSVSFEKSSIG